MKNLKSLFLLPAFLFAASVAVTSCGDNDDFTSLHVLSDEEIETMRIQDSIRQAQLERINVDKLLEYDVEFYISSNSYDGTTLQIDADGIAQFFGITTDELNKGIAGEEGGAKITGFAIEGSTHADNMKATNTGSYWGHWWDNNGDVMDWGSGPTVFAEYDAETSTFNIGQYPGKLAADQTVTFIECLKYEDKRVGIKINVTGRERGAVTAQIVGTQQLAVSAVPKTDYSLESVHFDLQKALSDLGISSMSEATWVGVSADGSYAQEYTADPPGFWYDKEGFVGNWGDNASVFTAYNATDLGEDVIGVGQMPNGLAAGESVTIKYCAVVDTKIEVFEITFTCEAYKDPETAPEGDPESVSKELSFTKAFTTGYEQAEEVDVKDILRNAFKMTTYQIFSALKSGDLKVYVGEVTETDPEYTGSGNGEYWFDAEGKAAKYADGIVYGGLYCTETTAAISFGNHPDNCAPTGQKVTTKLIVVCKGVTATFDVTVDITAAAGAKKHK